MVIADQSRHHKGSDDGQSPAGRAANIADAKKPDEETDYVNGIAFCWLRSLPVKPRKRTRGAPFLGPLA